MVPPDRFQGYPGWRDWRRLLLSLVILGCGLTVEVTYAQDAADEYAVKAAYLFNFAKFVEWPPQALPTRQSPVTLCIAGRDPFGNALETTGDKSLRERPLVIRRLSRLEEFTHCHLLFLSDSESTRLGQILAKLKNGPILTVSDISGFADAGGMIGLVNVGQRIRFEINLPAVQKANLKISSQLLKLARIIGESGQY